jgi:hypothetical protein
MSGMERDEMESAFVSQDGVSRNMTNFRARIASLTIVDDEGKRLFSFEDISALASKSAAALDRVFEVAARLSRMLKKDVEELAGN